MATTRRSYLIGAIGCAASAAFIAWQAAIDSPQLRVPASIAFVAAFVFALTALRLMQMRENPEAPGDAFALCFFAAMATIGAWIALGAGPRACDGSLGDAVEMPASGLACRIPFGIGALLTGGCALYVASRILRARAGSSLDRRLP